MLREVGGPGLHADGERLMHDDELPDEADFQDEDDPEADQVPCPACGGWVYDDIDQCPHCGNWVVPLQGSSRPRRWLWALVTLLLVAALILLTVL